MKHHFAFWLLALTTITSSASCDTIQEWLDAAHKAPKQQLFDLAHTSAKIQSDAAYATLYPKFSLLASIEQFNAPTSLRPVPPTEISSITASNGAYPFVETMGSFGATVSMPLFVRSLLTNTKKAKENIVSQSLQRAINIAERDALLIGSNAQLAYLENLTFAQKAKELSLNSMRESLVIKTRNGRAAEIELIKVDEQINQTHLKLQEIQNARYDVQKIVATLINKPVLHSVPMQLHENETTEGSLALLAKKQELKVAALNTQMAKEALYYPALTLHGNYFYRAGNAYNNNDAISREYGSIGLNLTMPLYDKERKSGLELAHIEEIKASATLAQTTIEIENSYKTLSDQYLTLKQSRLLALQSISNYEAMLKTAKVAYETQRMIQEEYLRYEDALLSAKASLYAIDANIWQNIAKRAAIRGTDFKEIIQ